MKPASFLYVRPATVDEAVAALAENRGSARLLAGGQSLVPMMNFRIVETPLCIDINRIDALAAIETDAPSGLRLGALTRHLSLELSPDVQSRLPVLAEAMGHVGHLAIRNRGTIGGSLCHADPAAELPAMALLLDAVITAASPSGSREISAADFFLAPLTTSLDETEIVTSVFLPALPRGTGWGFHEVARRHGDFAVAGAAATLTKRAGRIAEARISLFGVHDTPLRAIEAEELLIGNEGGPDYFAAAAAAARDAVQPMNDLHGSADFRRHLTQVLTVRALESAASRAEREGQT